MTLLPSDYTKAMWPADFKATQTITLKDGALTAAMAVTNNGKEAFTFTGSFHTYFNAAIGEVKVGGLDGLKMTDRLASKDMTNKGDVSISGPVDACYYDAPKKLTLAVGSPARLLWHINAVGAAPPSG
jgi:glucose-6-phosphate 1-epimerase